MPPCTVITPKKHDANVLGLLNHTSGPRLKAGAEGPTKPKSPPPYLWFSTFTIAADAGVMQGWRGLEHVLGIYAAKTSSCDHDVDEIRANQVIDNDSATAHAKQQVFRKKPVFYLCCG